MALKIVIPEFGADVKEQVVLELGAAVGLPLSRARVGNTACRNFLLTQRAALSQVAATQHEKVAATSDGGAADDVGNVPAPRPRNVVARAVATDQRRHSGDALSLEKIVNASNTSL